MSAVRTPQRPRLHRYVDRTPPWTGEYRPYDLVKEFVAALAVVTLLTVVLAVVFSSPDEKRVTLQEWATAAPGDFVTTALAELDGTSDTAQYGAPYNKASDGQTIGPLKLQKWAGVSTPIDTANDFVIGPLRASVDPSVPSSIAQWQAASATQQAAWADAYTKALDKATFSGAAPSLPAGDYGPVAPMMAALLAQARSGALDGALVGTGSFYQADYTRPLLFLADGGYLADLADKQHLHGDQWGMMNETGRYPGQSWLWLYTMWYQIKPFSTSDNADAWVWGVMMVLTVAFILIPWLPGIRSIPRATRLYRLIWRDHYRQRSRTS